MKFKAIRQYDDYKLYLVRLSNIFEVSGCDSPKDYY